MNSTQSTLTAGAKGLFRILAVCIPVLMLLCVAQGVAQERSGEPSDGAKGMPGALGTIPFMPDDWIGEGVTTYWIDTDGVDPGVAGCHYGVQLNGAPNGRFFGEACESPQILIESNPGAGVIHPHINDTGHPDRFACAMWCVGTRRSTTGGVCRAVPGPPPCSRSAMFVCNPQ